jgi:peroxiredoxin
MPPVLSRMIPLGTPAPAFDLPATRGGRVSLDSLGRPSAILVAFICNHCPFVKHVRDELGRLERDFRGRGLAMVGICSNDPERYPQDGFDAMAAEARDAGWEFPYLHDADQSVARAYRATCTPDFFLFDAGRRLAYRGQLDDSRPGNGKPVTGADLRGAIEAVLAGRAAPEPQVPSIGCSIKWRPGSEPSEA